jgi:hypothetical protein
MPLPQTCMVTRREALQYIGSGKGLTVARATQKQREMKAKARAVPKAEEEALRKALKRALRKRINSRKVNGVNIQQPRIKDPTQQKPTDNKILHKLKAKMKSHARLARNRDRMH